MLCGGRGIGGEGDRRWLRGRGSFHHHPLLLHLEDDAAAAGDDDVAVGGCEDAVGTALRRLRG